MESLNILEIHRSKKISKQDKIRLQTLQVLFNEAIANDNILKSARLIKDIEDVVIKYVYKEK